MVWLGNYYMFVVKHNEDVLHLKRAPTWRSVLLFAGKNCTCFSVVPRSRNFAVALFWPSVLGDYPLRLDASQ